jgi:transcriptional regulator with XRE-family HTH domain
MQANHPLKVWIDENSTQVAVAREAGISPGYLSEILSDKKEPSLDVTSRLVKISGLPFEVFVGRVGRNETAGASQ